MPPLRARGTLRITHGAAVRRLIGRLIALPPTGDVATTLEVQVQDGLIHWHRDFGGFKAGSIHEVKHDGFIEQAGPFRLVVSIVPKGGSVAHHQRQLRIGSLPVPLWLGPQAEGKISSGSSVNSWRIEVTIRNALLGTLLTYEGEMTAE